MKIGLLSDTHGNLPRTKLVAQLFKTLNVEAILHSGDIGGFDVLTELAATEIPIYAVLGNCDTYAADWKYYPTNVGVQLLGRFGNIELDGKKIALLHSDDTRRFNKAISCGDYNLVISGHSHEHHDIMIESTRCINPGAVTRAHPPSCATLDLKSGELNLYPLE